MPTLENFKGATVSTYQPKLIISYRRSKYKDISVGHTKINGYACENNVEIPVNLGI